MLVHDLESPLASISFSLELIESGRLDMEKELHRRMISGSRVAADRARTIIHDILTTAKAESSGLQADLTRIDPVALARESMSLALPTATQNEVTLTFRKPANVDDSLRVLADERLTSRIIDNLLYNALRHTSSGETITLAVDCQEEKVIISITDNGSGIAGVDPQTLFKKFGQSSYRKEKKTRGVGLGLYFCRLAADAMKAEIFAENIDSGGARFGIAFDSAKSDSAG